jgi:hypothetical protein
MDAHCRALPEASTLPIVESGRAATGMKKNTEVHLSAALLLACLALQFAPASAQPAPRGADAGEHGGESTPAPIAARRQLSADEKTIQALLERFADAQKQKSLELLRAAITKDFVLIQPGGGAWSREYYEGAQFRHVVEAFSNLRYDTHLIRGALGAKTGYGVFSYDFAGKMHDRPVEAHGLLTAALVLTRDGWRISHIHQSSTGAGPPNSGAGPAASAGAPDATPAVRSGVVNFATMPLSSPSRKALGPDIAAGPDGSLNAIWVDRGPIVEQPAPASAQGPAAHQSEADLYYARSIDGGWNWSGPSRVNSNPDSVWGAAVSKPRIAIGPKGVIHVFYPANEISQLTGKSIIAALYTRSTDGGRTFENSRRLNSLASGDLSSFIHGGFSQAHAFGTVAAGPDRSVYAFWIDTREMSGAADNGAMYMAVSRDDGKNFGPDRRVFGGDVCPCCQFNAHVDARGSILVGSRMVSPEGNRDAVVARSDDGGRTFASRVPIGGAHWKIDGCPLKPTAVNRQGDVVYAAVYSGGEQQPGAYFARSLDGGASFIQFTQIHPGAIVSDAPAIAARDATVTLLWQAKVGAERRLFMRESRDRGVTFGAPVEMPTPPGNATLPAVATAGDATAIVWQQGDQVFFGRYRASAR